MEVGTHPAKETRLLTRHLEEVWFPGHACQCLGTSLFTSLFAGKREVPPWVGEGGLSTHKNVTRGAAQDSCGELGKLMGPPRPEEKALRNRISKPQNVEIHERFGIAVPRPRGKPRGT